jgi:periplasmic glucans biosynthesis protein
LAIGRASKNARQAQDQDVDFTMATSGFDRRLVLKAVGGWAMAAEMFRWVSSSSEALAQAAPPPADAGEAIGPDHVQKLAQQLATRPFVKPKMDVPDPFNKLTVEQYREIRFRREQAAWRGDKLDYELQMFPMGWLYDAPVELWLVDGGRGRQLRADGTLFTVGVAGAPQAAPFGFSGFRVHGPINRSDYLDEYVLFQGASYFRAVGRGQNYGMSARGLAINTARPGGEEIPMFRGFWIEKPKPGAAELVVHALLDSPSVTGAYRFGVQPGAATILDVDVTLYPRRELTYVGFAPLNSMFLTGAAHRRIQGDIRPAVHDSEGLAILNGRGERIWRPLTNPKKLQTSAFVDKDPKGFGLSQRDRSFASYEDIDARYERRPTVWVETKGAWGDGAIELLEIPVEEEIHDNVTVFWRPAKPIEVDKPFKIAYKLHWADAVPVAWTGARVRKTRIGAVNKKGLIPFAIDFDGPALKEGKELPVADVTATGGTVQSALVQRHAEIDGLRCTFELAPGTSELVELRLALKSNDQLVSENWLYRWTKL